MVNISLEPPGIILTQSTNTETLCSDFAIDFAEKIQGIRKLMHTKLTNDEDYFDYVIDAGSQRVSKELNPFNRLQA